MAVGLSIFSDLFVYLQWSDVHIQARYRQLEQATVFAAFLGEETNRWEGLQILGLQIFGLKS